MKNFFDIIQDYLDGTLTTADSEAFEKALQSDKALANELALYQNLEKGIELGANIGLRNTLKTVQSNLKNQGFFLNDSDIDLYLDNQLDAEKLEGFNFRLAHDADFAAEVDMQQDLIKGINIGTDAHLRNIIKDANQSYFEEKTPIIRALNTDGISRENREGVQVKVRRIGIQWWAAAASIALLIAASIWYLSPSKPATYDNIAAQYFQAENERVKDIYAELSADGFAVDKVRNSSLKAALEAYQSKNYTLAKELLEKHLMQYSDDVNAQFYVAMTYVSLNEKEKAIPVLEKIHISTSTWINAAQWHLALIYWNIPEKHDIAVAYLTNIAENKGSVYQAKAIEILNKK